MLSPPHIVILNDFAEFNGGASAVALSSARELAARGHAVTLFAAVGPVDADLARTPNLSVVCLGGTDLVRNANRLAAFTSGLWNGPARRALAETLGRLDPANTVVHVHLWMKALSPSVFAAAFAGGFPVVITLHDFFLACPNGGFYVYPKGEICHRRPLSLDCVTCQCDRRNYGHKLWRVARSVVQDRWLRVAQRAAHLVGVSEFGVNVLRPHLPADVPVTVVHNPIDGVDLGPAPVGEHDGFVFAGRLVPEKGPRLFAEAARRAGVRATFIGDGELRGELARDFPEVEITGWQTPAEVTARLRRARALVFPSRWYETLGLVVVEAAALGVPAVVSDGCAARDTVADGERGLHFPAGSVEGLAERLRALAGPAEGAMLAARLGRAAYDWYWSEPWTVERHVSGLLGVYAQVLGPPASPLPAATAVAAII